MASSSSIWTANTNENSSEMKTDEISRITILVCNPENYNNPDRFKELQALSGQMTERQKKVFSLYSQAKEINERTKIKKEEAEKKMELAKKSREDFFKLYKDVESRRKTQAEELRKLLEECRKEVKEFVEEVLRKVNEVENAKNEIRNLLLHSSSS